MALRLKRTFELLCGLVSAAALFAIVVLTTLDVGGRKLLDSSLPGSLEMTELLMVAVIFAALPLVSLNDEHVVFDSLDRWLPAWVLRAQRVAVDLLCLVALAGLAWLMWDKASQMASYGDTTAQLRLPLAPVVDAMSILCGLAAAVHALRLVVPSLHEGPR